MTEWQDISTAPMVERVARALQWDALGDAASPVDLSHDWEWNRGTYLGRARAAIQAINDAVKDKSDRRSCEVSSFCQAALDEKR